MNSHVFLAPAFERNRAIAAAKLGLSPEDFDKLRKAQVKWCSGHGKWLPVSAFGPCRSKGDGLQNLCRACTWQRAKQQRARQKQRKAVTA